MTDTTSHHNEFPSYGITKSVKQYTSTLKLKQVKKSKSYGKFK